MKKTGLGKTTVHAASGLIQLADSIEKEAAERQRRLIEKHSPYSDEINQCICTYEELRFYCSLGLTEGNVTRLSLIREIDPDMKVTCKGKRNAELMAEGHPPYAYDSEDGQIELHHIGQNPNAPFAELTRDEHIMHGSNKKLHKNTQESWRKDQTTESMFEKERLSYWKKRAQGNIECLGLPADEIPPDDELDDGFLSSQQVQQTVSRIFAESSPAFLYFLSDIAKSYALLKEFGSRTFADFMSQTSASHKIQCPHCRSEDYRLHGKYDSSGEKMQRYQCKQCQKTFSAINDSIISDSNLSFATWVTFIDCLYHGRSVEETARTCNISAKSVQNNRLRLFYALKLLDDGVRLQGKVVMDETYFLANFKGNRSKQPDFCLDRKPRERGSENQTNGLSKEYVCVECALDEYGVSVARVAGLGAPNHYKIQCAMQDSIDKNAISCIYADKEHALTKYAKANGYPIKQITVSGKRKKYDSDTAEAQRWIQKMNSFHSRLKKFMSKFAGISSDMLSGYLYLFTWIDRNRENDKIETYAELFSILVQPQMHKPLDEIAAIFTFRDIETPKRCLKKKPVEQESDRTQEILAGYIAGKSVAQLSRLFNLSRIAVRDTITRYRAIGGRKKAIASQKPTRVSKDAKPFEIPYPYKNVERDKQIYAERLAWQGSPQVFYEQAAARYGLATQTIKNIVSARRRVVSLQEPIYVNQHFEYKDLTETYQEISAEFSRLTEKGAGTRNAVQMLSQKYGYAEITIGKIIGNFNRSDLEAWDPNKKRKIAKIERRARDSAVFADFLRWDGCKTAFCNWASKEYNLSVSSIYDILNFSCVADPKRYEMTYEYPTQRKERRAD